jgi:guanine deaminase
MDRNSPDTYIETTAESLAATQAIVDHVQKLNNPLVTCVITPRFVPTCTSELMNGLGEIAKTHDLPIQSHISENVDEIKWVESLHPDCSSYSDVYDKHSLFNEKTIMAHGIHLSKAEIDLVLDRKVGLSHCPNSTYSLDSGILNVRHLLSRGVKLSLGTDVAGGYSASMLDAIRQTIIASKSKCFEEASVLQATNDDAKVVHAPINYTEAFYLATVGGAEVMGMEDQIGSFSVGKQFDAQLIDPEAPGSPFDVFARDSLRDIFQKFIFIGDDRNVEKVFVYGKMVVDRNDGRTSIFN